MGKWTAPKVVIDRFLSDQYVAACTVNVDQTYGYIDIGSGYTLIPGAPEEWGHGDGLHQGREDVTQHGHTISFRGPIFTDYLDGNWYENIQFYRSFGALQRYTGGSEPFDVYVHLNNNTWYADVYEAGSAAKAYGGKDPANHS